MREIPIRASLRRHLHRSLSRGGKERGKGMRRQQARRRHGLLEFAAQDTGRQYGRHRQQDRRRRRNALSSNRPPGCKQRGVDWCSGAGTEAECAALHREHKSRGISQGRAIAARQHAAKRLADQPQARHVALVVAKRMHSQRRKRHQAVKRWRLLFDRRRMLAAAEHRVGIKTRKPSGGTQALRFHPVECPDQLGSHPCRPRQRLRSRASREGEPRHRRRAVELPGE